MFKQTQQKRPISPSELFQKLFKGNFKQIECIDEVSQVKQQRQILISLITQYRQQISRRMQEYEKLQKLVIIRNKLRIELENVRNDRISIDRNIQYEIEKNKLSSVQVNDHEQWRLQMQQIRHKNYGLQVRLRQLTQYCMKIQRQNSLLHKQKQIIVQQFNVRARANSDIGIRVGFQDQYLGWRQKINARRIQQEKFNLNIMQKVKEKQQRSLYQAKQIQFQIEERNRKRMASFQQRLSHKYQKIQYI